MKFGYDNLIIVLILALTFSRKLLWDRQFLLYVETEHWWHWC